MKNPKHGSVTRDGKPLDGFQDVIVSLDKEIELEKQKQETERRRQETETKKTGTFYAMTWLVIAIITAGVILGSEGLEVIRAVFGSAAVP